MPAPRRIVIALVIAGAVFCAAAATALAAGNPGRQPLGPGPDVTIHCPQGYSGVLHDQVNNEYVKTYVEADGTVRQQVNGRLLETFTGNGKVITFNGSGPGTITFFPDDSITAIFHGLTVRIPRTDAGLWVYTGLVSVDPTTGNILSHSGSVRDICAELA